MWRSHKRDINKTCVFVVPVPVLGLPLGVFYTSRDDLIGATNHEQRSTGKIAQARVFAASRVGASRVAVVCATHRENPHCVGVVTRCNQRRFACGRNRTPKHPQQGLRGAIRGASLVAIQGNRYRARALRARNRVAGRAAQCARRTKRPHMKRRPRETSKTRVRRD